MLTPAQPLQGGRAGVLERRHGLQPFVETCTHSCIVWGGDGKNLVRDKVLM